MSEFSRIARYFAPLAGEAALGLLDDAAVFTPPPGRELVVTTDQMVEGVHFITGDAPRLVARKLLRRNLSDLAAMGAEALGYLLTTALPVTTPEDWLADFAAGLAEDQQHFNIALFGGDSTSTTGPIVLTATLLGHLIPGTAWRRNGAKPGDDIYVTGTIGDAALGLRIRRGELRDTSHGYLVGRSQLPSPRLGLMLSSLITAAIDISDGLVQDLEHICRASHAGATIHAHLVPVSQQAAAYGNAFLQARLTEGDDYELLFTAPPARETALRAACSPLPITKIGSFKAGPPIVQILDSAGMALQFTNTGWQHFK